MFAYQFNKMYSTKKHLSKKRATYPNHREKQKVCFWIPCPMEIFVFFLLMSKQPHKREIPVAGRGKSAKQQMQKPSFITLYGVISKRFKLQCKHKMQHSISLITSRCQFRNICFVLLRILISKPPSYIYRCRKVILLQLPFLRAVHLDCFLFFCEWLQDIIAYSIS